MKPTAYISFFMATLLWAACSSHENELEPQPGPAPVDSTAIAFGGAMDEGQEQVMGTRAETALEDKGVHSFKIWAYKNMSVSADYYGNEQTVINGYDVNWVATTAGTTATNTHDWEYVTGSQSIKYWDFAASAYRFFGYAPASAAVTVSGPTAGAVTLTVTADASDQTAPKTPYLSRLWFSNNDADHPAYGQTVQMRFIQPLAKVRFLFIDKAGDPFDNLSRSIDPSTISFKPSDGSKIPTAGNLSVSYPTEGTETELSFLSSTPDDAKSMTELKIPYATSLESMLVNDENDLRKWYYVLPMASQGTYTMSLSIVGVTKTAVVPEIYMRWLPGYYYTYVFKVSEAGLTFDSVQAGVRDWDEIAGDDHNVFNW